MSLRRLEPERYLKGEVIQPPFPKEPSGVVCVGSLRVSDDGERLLDNPGEMGKTMAEIYVECPRIDELKGEYCNRPVCENDHDTLRFRCSEAKTKRNREEGRFDFFCQRLSLRGEMVKCLIEDKSTNIRDFGVPNSDGEGGVRCFVQIIPDDFEY